MVCIALSCSRLFGQLMPVSRTLGSFGSAGIKGSLKLCCAAQILNCFNVRTQFFFSSCHEQRYHRLRRTPKNSPRPTCLRLLRRCELRSLLKQLPKTIPQSHRTIAGCLTHNPTQHIHQFRTIHPQTLPNHPPCLPSTQKPLTTTPKPHHHRRPRPDHNPRKCLPKSAK